MTDRERQYAALGYEYAEGIERAKVVYLPSGREVRRIGEIGESIWEVQPHNDNYWVSFDDLIEAIKFGIGKNNKEV